MPIDVKIDSKNYQIRDYIDTETYFRMVALDEKGMSAQTYFLLKELIMNPKLTEEDIKQLPISTTLKLASEIRKNLLPDQLFLELGVLPVEQSQE